MYPCARKFGRQHQAKHGYYRSSSSALHVGVPGNWYFHLFSFHAPAHTSPNSTAESPTPNHRMHPSQSRIADEHSPLQLGVGLTSPSLPHKHMQDRMLGLCVRRILNRKLPRLSHHSKLLYSTLNAPFLHNLHTLARADRDKQGSSHREAIISCCLSTSPEDENKNNPRDRDPDEYDG